MPKRWRKRRRISEKGKSPAWNMASRQRPHRQGRRAFLLHLGAQEPVQPDQRFPRQRNIAGTSSGFVARGCSGQYGPVTNPFTENLYFGKVDLEPT